MKKKIRLKHWCIPLCIHYPTQTRIQHLPQIHPKPLPFIPSHNLTFFFFRCHSNPTLSTPIPQYTDNPTSNVPTLTPSLLPSSKHVTPMSRYPARFSAHTCSAFRELVGLYALMSLEALRKKKKKKKRGTRSMS